MELTIMERLVALGTDLLPKEGDIVLMRSRQQLIEKLGLTDEEVEEYDIRQLEDGRIEWKFGADSVSKEIDLKIGEMNVLREALERLNSEKKLKPEQVSLYDKFVE